MNKLTKTGVSALCGSLAAVASANAGELTVTGGVDMTWTNISDSQTGNPIGMGSNVSFSGAGELDNGIGFTLAIDYTNGAALSNTRVVATIPALGDIRIDQGMSGTGMDRYDDKTPTVWEEANGTGLGTGIKTVTGSSAGSTIEWKPNMLPDGYTAYVAYSPKADSGAAADKATANTDSGVGSGYDIMLDVDAGTVMGVDGLSVFAGMSSIDQANGVTYTGDRSQYTMGANYAVGSVTVGYQYSRDNLQNKVAASTSFYENNMYGITFQINDDLSIGYNHIESEQNNHGADNVTAEATSFQIAYTMGGASIRLAEASMDDGKYQTGTSQDKDATTLSVALAF